MNITENAARQSQTQNVALPDVNEEMSEQLTAEPDSRRLAVQLTEGFIAKGKFNKAIEFWENTATERRHDGQNALSSTAALSEFIYCYLLERSLHEPTQRVHSKC